jgi:hypothetical protein
LEQVNLPEDTVEDGNPSWIESPRTGFGVDVLTVRYVVDETSISQNRARDLVLKAYHTYELSVWAGSGSMNKNSPSVLAVKPAIVQRRKTRRNAHIDFINGKVSSSDLSWFSLNSVAFKSCSK